MTIDELVAAYHAFELNQRADKLGQGRVAVELRERIPGARWTDVAAVLERATATVHRRARRYLDAEREQQGSES